jgi:putative transcriptional regulator
MKRIQKRNLFEELKQGIEEVKAHQKGKITLRTHEIKKKPRLEVDAKLIRNLRDKLNMSRSVFALKLRVSLRTLEKWEQGETIPNDQAAALILMLKKYPDTLQRLDEI